MGDDDVTTHSASRSARMHRAERTLHTFAAATGLGVLAALGLTPATSWASAFGTVRGTVHTLLGKPVSGATVELQSVESGRVRLGQSGRHGRFVFQNVSVGRYTVTVSGSGYAPASEALTLVPGYFPNLTFRLHPAGTLKKVTISARVQAPVVAAVTPITLVSAQDIQFTPGAIQTNSLAMITDYVPGAYIVHDMLHVRGGHQTAWLVDGVEIPNTNIASNLGPQIDPQDIQVLGVERGSYNADQGDRTYGIFNVIPKSGFGRKNQAVLDVTAGNYGQTDDYLSVASHTRKFAYYASIDGDRSSLGIGTPVRQVIHDQEQGYGGFTNLIYEPDSHNELRFVAAARKDQYQIPIYPGQRQNDVQREADTFAILSWEHTFSDNATLTSSLLYHYNRADLIGALNDYPTSTTSRHTSTYEGGQEKLQMKVGRNHLGFGLFGFAQQDTNNFSLLFNQTGAAPLYETLNPTGGLFAAYAQDTYHLDHWVNLSAGVRYTYFTGGLTETATSPRTGITVRVPHLNWVFSAFWGKYFQAPPLDTLSGPLATYASSNNTAFLPLHAERDREREFGVTIPFEGWTIHADYFVNEAKNFFDHNAIGNTNIYFPLTDAGALIRARELTVRSPMLWNRVQVHIAYSNQTADAFGGITGGLTNFAPPAGYYALDHDQRNTFNGGLNANLPENYFVSAELYIGSGFSNGNAAPPTWQPSHLPSHARLDLSVGRAISRNLRVSLTALNVFNKHLLIDNSLTFGGEHWNNPFEIYAEVHYKFHY